SWSGRSSGASALRHPRPAERRGYASDVRAVLARKQRDTVGDVALAPLDRRIDLDLETGAEEPAELGLSRRRACVEMRDRERRAPEDRDRAHVAVPLHLHAEHAKPRVPNRVL